MSYEKRECVAPELGRMKQGQAGRRTLRGRLPKDYLMDLFSRLHSYGLGGWAVQSLTGYSSSTVCQYNRDSGCKPHTATTVRDAIIRNLPPDLAAECKRVRLKSMVCHERSCARGDGVDISRRVHTLDD